MTERPRQYQLRKYEKGLYCLDLMAYVVNELKFLIVFDVAGLI
jgi:hypothetical protein